MISTNTVDEGVIPNQEVGVQGEPPVFTGKERIGRYRYTGNHTYYDDMAYHQFFGRPTLQILQLMGLTLELLIAFRIFLKAIGANPQAGFAHFVYGLTNPFLAPFSGLISNPANSISVLEISSFIALVVYAILFWLVSYSVALFWNR